MFIFISFFLLDAVDAVDLFVCPHRFDTNSVMDDITPAMRRFINKTKRSDFFSIFVTELVNTHHFRRVINDFFFFFVLCLHYYMYFFWSINGRVKSKSIIHTIYNWHVSSVIHSHTHTHIFILLYSMWLIQLMQTGKNWTRVVSGFILLLVYKFITCYKSEFGWYDDADDRFPFDLDDQVKCLQ